jgi:hypothetical protein
VGFIGSSGQTFGIHPFLGRMKAALSLPRQSKTRMSFARAWRICGAISKLHSVNHIRQIEREMTMKCMIFVKASTDSEKGAMPGPELLAAMGKYNEELFKAGNMKGGGGLKPTSQGKRVRFSGAQRTAIDARSPRRRTKWLATGWRK